MKTAGKENSQIHANLSVELKLFHGWLFLSKCSLLWTGSGGVVGHFPAVLCDYDFRENKNVSDKHAGICRMVNVGE